MSEDEHVTEDHQVPEDEASTAAGVRASALTLAASCLSVLAAKAWEAMGLVPSEATKQIERNLDEAQLAIDAAAALAEVLRPRVPETERREIENLIATLRLNYVEQKSKMP